MKKTIGGDRIGSGSKMQTSLHEYNRSTFNLSEGFKTTAAAGVLYPCYVNIGLNGDTFDIDCDALVRTQPTIGPLFGSFKLQIDFYVTPARLYNSKLHNNPVGVGMKMNQIKIPQIELKHKTTFDKLMPDIKNCQIASNSLLKYLGISGIGYQDSASQDKIITREYNALPILAYYDIFKNYYANKQEKNAYIITGEQDVDVPFIRRIQLYVNDVQIWNYLPNQDDEPNEKYTIPANDQGIYKIYGERLNIMNINLFIDSEWEELDKCIQNGEIILVQNTPNEIQFKIGSNYPYELNKHFQVRYNVNSSGIENFMCIEQFPLENIDEIRDTILTSKGNTIISEQSNLGLKLPLNALVNTQRTNTQQNPNIFPMNGLCLKTYQSDIFNNWVQTDWIDGENGISELTKVDTSDGLKIDALNLAQKVYNMLNRIAVSGGTYEDWQEAVYGQKVIRRAETPIFCGGMSSEIIFEEIVTTSETNVADNIQKAGTLAGKGTLLGKKGGHIIIKVEEPSIIMGIMSITPRLDYIHGNAWYMTNLKTFDDLHKPALDGIGFQELMLEQMAWWDTTFQENTQLPGKAIGKTPAWINYMTAVNKAYGQFAEKGKLQYMILARDYDFKIENQGTSDFAYVGDATTYIDPQKYNYPFAYQNLDAQNFWVQIHHKVTARRVMSAKVIPNL